jgi:RNA recognition motif-containing protein
VCAARVITDRISGFSRGFGFVKYATVQEAGEAIKGMDGKVSAKFTVLVMKDVNHIECS